ncbi:MAG: hypothetical protein KC441_11230 [Anaerolineales bacterium]|nr:hypothetical protein [Anaerolineales bacterium]
MPSISPQEIQEGYLAFQQRERRDAMYKTAVFLIDHFWGQPAEMADSLGVLLLTWNQAFYRYGLFDFDSLEACIVRNQHHLQQYRQRDILSYSPGEDTAVAALFEEFLNALMICEGKKAGIGSPVAVAKALHLLAPGFFPLWDDKIARAYGCYYGSRPADKYIVFLHKMKHIAAELQPYIAAMPGKTLLKLIDEYNYAKFTKKWI